jgi:RNA polymerase sigma-70 factor (ECF subfamily)
MDENKILSERFARSRARLRAIAYRMLGSASEADDAVQEAWLRLVRADGADVDNLTAWLTTVVARICLDVLRARKARREEPISAEVEELPAVGGADEDNEIADSVGVAMLVVLETLPAAERVAFVLHDMFDLTFDAIAPVLGRSSAAARQLASRARRRIQGASATPEVDRRRQREVVAAFLAASREGDFSALLALLDPDVVARADAAAVEASVARASRGAPPLRPEILGREAVAEVFNGRAGGAQPALVDGAPGLVWAPGGRAFAVFDFVVENGRIVEINLIADTRSIAALEVQF